MKFTDKIFFKRGHVYLPDRCMFPIYMYGKHVAELRWLTVVRSFSLTDSKLQGLVKI